MSSYRSKIITLDDRFATGEPTVQLVSTWGRDGRILREETSISKIASIKSPAAEYAKTVEPEPGKTIVLIVGLGDHETYGPNRNGDGFPSEPIPGKIKPDEVLTKHYKTYENARVYEHHANSDPSKAIGRVKKAFWNPYMRRVEVIEDFDNAKAPHLLEKIAAGEYPARSMGCVNFDTLVFCNGALVPIQEIKEGDAVLTHRGNWKRVTELHRRQYIGKLFSIRTATGVSSATSEHPYAVLHKHVIEEPAPKGHRRRKSVDQIDLEKIDWVPAEALEVGDYLVTPFDTAVKETLSVDECRFLGYYAAEGFTSSNSNSRIIMTHHKDDALPKEMIKLGKCLGFAPTTTSRQNSSVAQDTCVVSSTLTDLCNKHVGKYAAHKRLSMELMQQPKEQQLIFLGAYINGDGGCKKTGDYYISTCNKTLAYQLQQMGFRCGLYSKINTLHHKPSKIVLKETTEYQVSFSRKSAHTIAPYTEKVKAHVMKDCSTGSLFVDGAVLSKIKDIFVIDFDGPVYNLEVEDDNSFVAENHAIHNCRIKYDVCSICGNKARTRAEYCDHLKYEMGRIYETGKQASALNPSPNFFDSSWVIRPADRTGYMLKKVARESIPEINLGSFDLGEIADTLRDKAAALRKAADIEKVISGEPAASVSSLTPEDTKLIQRYNNEICPGQPKVNGDKLVRIMIAYKPSEATGTLDAMDIPAGIKELIQYFMGRMAPQEAKKVDEGSLKSASQHLGFILDLFSEYPRFFDDVVKLGHLVDDSCYSEKLAAQLDSVYEPKGIVSDYMFRHTVPAAFRGSERPLTDLVSYSDPATGQTYQTDYGTVQQMHDRLVGRAVSNKAISVAPYLGGSALLGGATLAMGLNKKLRGLPQVATGLGSLGLGALGLRKALQPADIPGPIVRTDAGEDMSGWTEMVPKRASHISPEMLYISRRYQDRDKTALSIKQASILRAEIKMAEIHDEVSPYMGPSLDIDLVAQALGNAILTCTE